MNQTDSLIQQYDVIQQQVTSLLDGLSDAQWRWSPSPKDWSIALCVQHINTVNRLVLPRVEAAIEQGRASNLTSPGPFRYPLFDRLFVFGLEPRAPVKSKSPKIYRPEDSPSLPETRAHFLDLHSRLAAAVRGAAGLDWVRIKAASPVSNRLRFSLGTWFNAVLAHEDNHLQQAQKVAAHPGFPS